MHCYGALEPEVQRTRGATPYNTAFNLNSSKLTVDYSLQMSHYMLPVLHFEMHRTSKVSVNTVDHIN